MIADMLEENWLSMDLFADMLVKYLPQVCQHVDVDLFRLPLKRRLGNFSRIRATAIDRLIGRHIDYPRQLRRSSRTDISHIVDQSYAAAAASLPNQRTVITCHDLDAFAPLMAPLSSIRDRILSRLAELTLRGLQAAARIVCVSETVKGDLVDRGWIRADRIDVIPAGVHPACSKQPDPIADAIIGRFLGPCNGPEILHVGSTIPRKRIDILLQAFAAVRARRPNTRLLRAGGTFTAIQRTTISDLGLNDSIVTLPLQTRANLAALYRRATLVVLPSDSEGFGLPLVEAMACGTPVLAADIGVLREVGGDVTAYAPEGDAARWAEAILSLLDERDTSQNRWDARINRGVIHSGRFTWPQHAQRLCEVYDRVMKQ